MDLIAFLADIMPDLPEVTIAPYAGTAGTGDTWGTPAPVRAYVDDTRRLVRAADGKQVVSSATVYAPLDTACPPGSRITLPDGRPTYALAVARRDGHGAEALPEHVEIACE